MFLRIPKLKFHYYKIGYKGIFIYCNLAFSNEFFTKKLNLINLTFSIFWDENLFY